MLMSSNACWTHSMFAGSVQPNSDRQQPIVRNVSTHFVSEGETAADASHTVNLKKRTDVSSAVSPIRGGTAGDAPGPRPFLHILSCGTRPLPFLQQRATRQRPAGRSTHLLQGKNIIRNGWVVGEALTQG
eukprot:gene14460-biopygen14184